MTTDPRMALRSASDGSLDDVVVRDVSMFRGEMLDRGRLWLCCYLPGTGVDGDRVSFEVVAKGDQLEFVMTEQPEGLVTLEPPGE